MNTNDHYEVSFHNPQHTTIEEKFEMTDQAAIDNAVETYRKLLADPNLKSAEIVILGEHHDHTILLESVIVNKVDSHVTVDGSGWLLEPATKIDSYYLFDEISRCFDFEVAVDNETLTDEELEKEPRYINIGTEHSITLRVKEK